MIPHKHTTLIALGLAIGISTLFATPVQGASIRISVKDDLNKDREYDKSNSGSSSKKTTTESMTYELDIQVSNTSKQESTCDLEWYFFKRNLDSKGDKGDTVLCEKDKTSLTVGGQKRVSHKVTSETLWNTESKTSKNSSGNKVSSAKETFSGSVYDGYTVLARQDGIIVAKYSNEKKFLTDEWLGKLAGSVSSGSDSKSSGSSKKKKKKK